ncbi:MAG: hypothetical protein QXW57_04555, partial [Candidatus Micrarchaeaceae archaeon]
MSVDRIVPTLVRHIIRRYLKYVGFAHADVEHVVDWPFSMRLIVTGEIEDFDEKIKHKVNYLEWALHETQKKGQIDIEELRLLLAKEEPRMKKVYY